MSAVSKSPLKSAPPGQVTLYESDQAGPATPIIGAELSGIQLGAALIDQQVQTFHDAFLQYQTQIFRDQHMTICQHQRFGRQFGSSYCHPATPGPEGPILHADERRQIAASACHFDGSADNAPDLDPILREKIIRPDSGDTCLANLYSGYHALPNPIKRFASGLTAIHLSEHVFPKLDGTVANYPSGEQPLI